MKEYNHNTIINLFYTFFLSSITKIYLGYFFIRYEKIISDDNKKILIIFEIKGIKEVE